MLIVCYAPFNGQVDCGNGIGETGVEGDNCTFSCNPGYMLQGSVTSGTCENTGSWSGGLRSCVPLNCTSFGIPADGVIPSSCELQYQSQCNVSCDEGFTGDDVTYLCNITSDSTLVHWIAINNTITNHTCSRGLLPYTSDSYFWYNLPHTEK